MEHDQEIAALERVRALADAVGLTIGPERLPALADAFDGARLMIAQLEDLARRADVPGSAAYEPAWDGGKDHR